MPCSPPQKDEVQHGDGESGKAPNFFRRSGWSAGVGRESHSSWLWSLFFWLVFEITDRSWDRANERQS
jgi:hypothetical protein